MDTWIKIEGEYDTWVKPLEEKDMWVSIQHKKRHDFVQKRRYKKLKPLYDRQKAKRNVEL